MKKALSLVLACGMIITVLCGTAMAAENPIELGPHPGVNQFGTSNENEVDYAALIDEMIQTRIETYAPTADELNQAQEIINLYDSITTTTASVRSGFDDNWYKLRYGNLIELTLDYDEGISNSVATNAVILSNTAKDEAEDNFSSYWDSAQHFIWNFKLADTYSKTTARTITNNHEWGIAMITPMLNHFESAYDEYIADGYSENTASNKALADTIVYMPVFKYDSVCVIEASYNFFDYFFTDESIMDFWNNCYGRAYPEKGYSSGITAFRYSAFTARELVLDGSVSMADNLTESQKQSVWSWDWYSY